MLRVALCRDCPRCGWRLFWRLGFLCGVSVAAAVTQRRILFSSPAVVAVYAPAPLWGLGEGVLGAGPAGGAFFGVDDGDLQMRAVPALGSRALVGGADVLRRRCRLDSPVLRFGKLGFHPRPVCHRDMDLVARDGEHNRS